MQYEIGTKLPILDRGWVRLDDMMPHPSLSQNEGGVSSADLAIVDGARKSFGQSRYRDMGKNVRLLDRLQARSESSPFEQVEFKFSVYAPNVVLWHLCRYRDLIRFFSWNVISGRYQELERDEWYIPQPHEWRRQSESNRQASDGHLSPEAGLQASLILGKAYENAYEAYERLLALGVAREQARLPLAHLGAYSEVTWKGNALAFLNLIVQRDDDSAQHETRVYAQAFRQVWWWALPQSYKLIFGEGDAM